MRKIFFFLCFGFISFFSYAGDIANFVNLGFSSDGTKFAFGQYGRVDTTYRSYAEIYCVDVQNNSFLPSGVFKTSPTKETENTDGKTTFLKLLDRANYSLEKWKINQKNEGRPLYVLTDQTLTAQTLTFRDFETNDEYTVIMHKEKKSNLEAAFYITVEVIKPNGAKNKYEIGQKGKIRSGIRDYTIKKVIIDNTNKSLIFIIEKLVYDKSGNSTRYMVEAMML